MNKFRIWVPTIGVLKNLHTEALYDDYEGFRILLKGDDPTKSILRIKFETHLAYRNVDEGDRWKTISEVADFSQSALFVVDNSSWVQWFCEESSGTRQESDIVHYVIVTSDDFIDVLSLSEPSVEWLNE